MNGAGSETAAPASRPLVLTILCLASLAGLSLGLIGKLAPALRCTPDTLANAYEIPIEFLFPVGLVATIGIWFLRRWAVFTVVGYGVNLALAVHPGFVAPAFSVGFLVASFLFWGRMR